MRLSDYRGRPVVLNFWASWCGPCKEEAPVLAEGWKKWSALGVVFLGVDSQDIRAWAREFLEKYGIGYPNGFDGSGEVKARYGVTGFPETFFISPDGRVVGKWVGPLDQASLDARIQVLLGVRG